MPLSFPSPASGGQTYTGPNGITYTYDASIGAWTAAAGGGGGSVTSWSGGTTGLTPSTDTTGAVSLGGTLGIANGGTGSTTQAGAASAILPDQSGQNGKFLKTDGSNASWSVTGDLPLTGGNMTGRINVQIPNVNGGAGFAMLKGPGSFPSGTGIDTSWHLGTYDPTNEIGFVVRNYATDPANPSFIDALVGNGVGTTPDNWWLFSSRQMRLNANVSAGTPAITVYLFGSPQLGGTQIAFMSTNGQWSVVSPSPTQLYAPPVSYGAGLTEILALTPQSFQLAIDEVDESGTVIGTQPSETVNGFTYDDLLANFPSALVSHTDESGDTYYGVNQYTLITGLVSSVQELSQALDTLRSDFDNYVATHP